jgi:hypothetical protein
MIPNLTWGVFFDGVLIRVELRERHAREYISDQRPDMRPHYTIQLLSYKMAEPEHLKTRRKMETLLSTR